MGKELYDIIGERIVILDGGMGTMIQRYGLREEEYRGEEFASWHLPLKGCNDLLALTRPEVIGEIHRAYLEAGADIITTDSFNANRISLADYRLQEHAYAISRAAAQVARRTADDYMREHPQAGPRFVSGSVGPTSKSSSIATDMNDTARREVDFEGLVAAYTPQIEGLVDGGADIIQFETFFDIRRRGGLRLARKEASPYRVGNAHQQRTDALRTDRRGILRIGRACPAAGRRF